MDGRRPSYASVAGGNAASSSPGQAGPVRSGAFAHLMNPSNTPSTYNYGADMDDRAPNPNHQHHLPLSESTPGQFTSNPHQIWGKSGAAPGYWGSSPLGAYTRDKTAESSSFLRPSYLRGTRYMDKLEAANRARFAAQREALTRMPHTSKAGSLSTSSSSLSVHKTATSHRGKTYESSESTPHIAEEDAVPPLPSQWKERKENGGLTIFPDRLDLLCSMQMENQEHEAAAARTDHPMPSQCGIYYYEVQIISTVKEGSAHFCALILALCCHRN